MVEVLATERYGAGTAISADRKCGGYVVTVWDSKGKAIVTSGLMTTKVLAVREMRTQLERRTR